VADEFGQPLTGEAKSKVDQTLDSAVSESPAVVGYLASVMMTAVATILAVGVDREVSIPNLSLVFVVPVISAAVVFGLGPSLCSAVLGALSYNFFLTEPRYSLAVDDPANIWAIGLLFVIGLIVSGVAFTSRRRAVEASLLERRVTVLQGYSRDVIAADDTKAIVAITSRALFALFKAPVAIIFVKGNVASPAAVSDLELQDADLEAALSASTSGLVARAGIYPYLASRFDFWPVTTRAGQSAVIGVAFDPDDRPSNPGAPVDIVVSILALALDRQDLRGKHDA